MGFLCRAYFLEERKGQITKMTRQNNKQNNIETAESLKEYEVKQPIPFRLF